MKKNVAVEQVEPVLEVINLTKHYKGRKAPAISEISFKVLPGEFHAFIGANGAGKTTTIKSIVGAYSNKKLKGQIKINGHLNHDQKAKDFLGYIPEVARFPLKMSLYKYLICMAMMSKKTKKESIALTNKIIDELNLTSLKKASPNTFSSGQKKKVLLAQALINEPKIVIMDEPAANLDPAARIEFFDTLKTMKKNGVSVLMSSHILSELSKYADSLTILDGGKIQITGKIDDIEKDLGKEYQISVSDENLFKRFLIAEEINFTIRPEDNYFIIKIKNELEIKQIRKFIAKEQLEVINLSLNKESLESLYTKYVVKGSVDLLKKEN